MIRKLLTAVIAVPLLAACSVLPDSGAVHHRPIASDTAVDDAPYFAPPTPADGAAPTTIVNGFLRAMTANPLSTAVARSYLSAKAKSTWSPNEGTLIYEVDNEEGTGSSVVARLADAHRLDARGGWLAGPTGHTEDLKLTLVKEEGQWRIDNPPNALVVPTNYFESHFAPFNLYFFDQTERVVVPDIVYIPRGKQTAANLVRGLLSGPGLALAPVVRNAFPAGTDLDNLSVVVSGSGVAEVPLSNEMLKLSPADLNRTVVQLAWTLRQVPGITRVRITVDGDPIPLVDGSSDFSVLTGIDFGPNGTGAAPGLVGLQNGRVVSVARGVVDPVSSPLGKPGFSLRSVAASQDGKTIAAIAGNGRTVFQGPRSGRSRAIRTVLTDGTNLLPPTYDMFRDLWLVDRTSRGAVVHVVHGGKERVVVVPGITGRSVTSFTVSSDGTRMVATLASKANPLVQVADIVRSENGAVTSATAPRSLPVPDTDLGPALDVGWVGPTTLAVLTRSPGSDSRIVYVSIDGSPGDDGPVAPDSFAGKATELATSTDPTMPLYLVTTDGKLYQLEPTGRWSAKPVALGVTAAAYSG
ncbi:MAG: hypothetical protein JWR35_1946 [Marmoricola sp.]|nr:hypothetical protein [Marmoricola sp.]